MINIPTIDELKQEYLALAQADYPEADITQYSDYQAKASATAGMGARLSLDAYTLFNAVYPQNGNPFGINTQLAAKGVPSQYPASPTMLTCTVNDIPAGKTYNIAVGTNVYADDGQIYKVISNDGFATIVQINTSFTTIYLLSANNGASTTQSVGATIKFTPPQLPNDGSLTPTLTTMTVTSVVAGTNEEALSSSVSRLIELDQTPLNGSRATDFKVLAIDPTNGITNAVVLVNNQLKYTSGNYNVAIFDAGGSEVTDEFLNKGLVVGTTAEVYSRSVAPAIYNTTLQKIVAQDIIGVFPAVNTVSTQAITTNSGVTPAFIQVKVTLQSGFTLSSPVVVDNVTLTLSQLIQRETRRAICGQPFGASLDQDLSIGEYLSSSIPTSSIEQQLDNSLGTPTTVGSLGNYLSSRSILFYNGSTYEYRPTINLNLGIPTSPTSPLAWVYDISLTPADIYSNILVVQV